MVENKGMNKKYNYAIIIGIVTLIGVLLLLFFAVKPLYSSAGKLTKEVELKQKNLATLRTKKAKLEELKDKEAELKEASAKVAAALPEGKDVGRLFIQFDELVKASSGEAKSVSEAGASGDTSTTNIGSVKAVSYSVPISLPTYFSFKDMASKMETALRLVTIDNLSIRSNNGPIDTTLSVVTYTR